MLLLVGLEDTIDLFVNVLRILNLCDMDPRKRIGHHVKRLQDGDENSPPWPNQRLLFLQYVLPRDYP